MDYASVSHRAYEGRPVHASVTAPLPLVHACNLDHGQYAVRGLSEDGKTGWDEEVLGFAVRPGVDRTGWKFGGDGRGQYESLHGGAGYDYVGEGKGSFEKEITLHYSGWRVRRGCVALLVFAVCLLVVGILLVVHTAARQAGLIATDGGSSWALGTTLEPFDCIAGYFNWRHSWTDDKKAWCCVHYARACSVTTTTTAMAFACQEEHSNLEAVWSFQKRHWCCKYSNIGCPQDNVATQHGLARIRYDCSSGNARQLWSASKRAWCCVNAGRGCQTSRTSTSTRAVRVSRVQTSAACDAVCVFDGEPLSCRTRVRLLAERKFCGSVNPCVEGLGLVLRQCSVCSGCALSNTGCIVAETRATTTVANVASSLLSTTLRVAPVPGARGCSSTCSISGSNKACGALIQLSATHMFPSQPNACELGRRQVLEQCPVCLSCSPASAGCVSSQSGQALVTTTSIPYNCTTRVHASWSPGKKAWCCLYAGHGCPAGPK